MFVVIQKFFCSSNSKIQLWKIQCQSCESFHYWFWIFYKNMQAGLAEQSSSGKYLAKATKREESVTWICPYLANITSSVCTIRDGSCFANRCSVLIKSQKRKIISPVSTVLWIFINLFFRKATHNMDVLFHRFTMQNVSSVTGRSKGQCQVSSHASISPRLPLWFTPTFLLRTLFVPHQPTPPPVSPKRIFVFFQTVFITEQ